MCYLRRTLDNMWPQNRYLCILSQLARYTDRLKSKIYIFLDKLKILLRKKKLNQNIIYV